MTANEFQLVGDPVKLVLAFELYKEFRFRLKAGNGEIIASSGAYETKANAKNGVDPGALARVQSQQSGHGSSAFSGRAARPA